MRRHDPVGLARLTKRRLFSLVVVAASLVALSVSAPAMATPKGPFAVFAQCPTKFPGVEYCIFGQVTSGEVAIGSTAVPISKTLTIQAGALPLSEEGPYALVPAANGESLSKTPLNVPGGLLDIINCKDIKGSGFFEVAERISCELVFENKTTGVTATTELVANTSNPAIFSPQALLGEEGTALTMPVRVHLNNPLLGSSCYIGSESSPIQLNLTTGTTSPPPPNKPITGKRGEFVTEGEGGILGLPEVSLVGNSFSVPKAEGCGGFFSFLIDPIVDAKLGLPSAAGHNTAILNGSQRIATAREVLAHE